MRLVVRVEWAGDYDGARDALLAAGFREVEIVRVEPSIVEPGSSWRDRIRTRAPGSPARKRSDATDID